jgi:transcriptional regulator with XRE-family HTH domain
MPIQHLNKASIPAAIDEALRRLGQAIVRARSRRGLRRIDLAKRVGISPLTLARVEHGSPTTSIGAYFAALWAMGLEREFGDIASPDRDEEGKTLELARSPERVDVKRALDGNF